MKKLTKIIMLSVLAAAIYSFIPVVGFYFVPDPAPYMNDAATGNQADR